MLRIVILVLDVNIAALLFVLVFVLEVVPAICQLGLRKRCAAYSLLLSGVLHKVIVVRHVCGVG